MKKIIVVAYFFVLSCILVVWGGFVFLPKYQPRDAYNISVQFSPFQSQSHPNVAYIKDGKTGEENALDHHSIGMRWIEKGGGISSSVTDDLNEREMGLYEFPLCPRYVCGDFGFECVDLDIKLYNLPQRKIDESIATVRQNENEIKSTTIPCDSFHFFAKPGITPFSDEYLKTLGVDREAVKDASLMDVIAPSGFVAGKPNEVLLACYIHGRPCQGNIEIEQLGDQENRIHKIIQADDTGITAFDLTIDDRSDFRFAVGDLVLNASFTPVPIQDGIHVDVHGGHYLPQAIDLPSSAGKNTVQLEVALEKSDALMDLKLDVFSDYAWIARKMVYPENGLKFSFPDPTFFKPDGGEYLFRNYSLTRSSGNKRGHEQFNEPQILFVRISTSGRLDSQEILPDEPSQTIPFIVWNGDRNVRINSEYRLVFGAIYQTFARIDALNELDSQNKGKQNTTRSAFDDAVVIAPYLLERMDAPLFVLKKDAFEKYLLAKLAQAHHPQLVTFNDADEVYTEEIFRAERGDKIRSVSVFVIIWLIVGIILFVVISRNVRIRRQQAWFDAAARGEAKGLLPGTPAWGKVMIGVFLLGIALLVYYMRIV